LLLRNRHVQTIVGHLWSGPRFRHPTRKHVLSLADGDRLVLHDAEPTGWPPGQPISVLVHGLGGCHDSGHLRRFARLLTARGVRTVRVDLRGTGEGLKLARKGYHAGCSDDLRTILEAVHRWSPTSPLWLLGVSLGGNVVLKLAGEAAAQPVPGLARVVALGPPIDMPRCSVLMSRRGNLFYNRYFARILVRQALERQEQFPDEPRVRFPRRPTLRIFDDLYTAPRNGFANADDYYRRASSSPLLPAIQHRTLILTARDDPFIAVEPFEELCLPGNVDLRIVAHGGHLGFVGRDPLGGMRWGEALVSRWLLSNLEV
jgi:predicted alpha/beta-fold hydrolase